MRTITQNSARQHLRRDVVAIALLVLFLTTARGADLNLERFYEPNRCGPIALYCICKSYKIDTTIDELAHLAGFDGRETSVAGLITAAEAKGLKAKGLESSMAHLTTLGGPAIIDYPKGHFCAFFGWNGTSAVILDPPKKSQLIPFGQLRRDWGRHVITFSVEKANNGVRPLPARLPTKGSRKSTPPPPGSPSGHETPF